MELVDMKNDTKDEIFNIHAKIIGETIAEKLIQAYKQPITLIQSSTKHDTTVSEPSVTTDPIIPANHTNPVVKYDDIEKISSIICICIDLFFTPFLFYVIWNCMMPELFGLPQITYMHALLFKIAIEFYFRLSLSSYFTEKESMGKIDIYVNKLYDKISKIELILDTAKKQKDKLNKEPKAYNACAVFEE